MKTALLAIRRRAAWLAALSAAGCRTPRIQPSPPGPPPMAALAPLVTPPPPPSAGPGSVYRNPKIGMVYLRAHQDAEGKLLGPQVMYQIIDPGGWNLDAVEQDKGYIAAANAATQPRINFPPLVPAREAPPLAPDSPLLDPGSAAQIVITGLMRPEDRPEAESIARRQGAGATAVFDEQSGWLLLPRAP